MADTPPPSLPVWVQALISSGVIGLVFAGVSRVWKRFVERPQDNSDAELKRLRETNEFLLRKNGELSGELKATGAALRSVRRLDEAEAGGPPTVPPPRAELPTLTAIIESRADRAWAEQRERERAAPLNPSVEAELRRYHDDMASTPPEPLAPPRRGKR